MSNHQPFKPHEPSLPAAQQRDMGLMTDKKPIVEYSPDKADATLPPFKPAGLPEGTERRGK